MQSNAVSPFPGFVSRASLDSLHSDGSSAASQASVASAPPIFMLPIVLPAAPGTGAALQGPKAPAGVHLPARHHPHDSCSSNPTPKTCGLDALLGHIDHGDLDAVKAGLAAGVPMRNAKAWKTGIVRAVKSGNPFVVKALLDAGALVPSVVAACQWNAPKAILDLLDSHGAQRSDWIAAVYAAARHNRPRPMVDLMKFVALRPQEMALDPQGSGGRHRDSLLMVAARAGSVEAVGELINQGLIPTWQGAGGQTAFDVAIANKQSLVVKTFIARAGKPSKGVLHGYLDAAVRIGAYDVAHVLISAGAKADKQQLKVAQRRCEPDMVVLLQDDIQAQRAQPTLLQRLKSVRLGRRETIMPSLSWDSLMDADPNAEPQVAKLMTQSPPTDLL